MRRFILDPGAGTSVVTLIAHSSGARPLLHSPGAASLDGPFQFQLTGDAGRTFAIQISTNLSTANWMTLTNLPNPNGTIWFTNPGPLQPLQKFFRARLLP